MHTLFLTITLLLSGLLFQTENNLNYSYKIPDLRLLFEKASKDEATCDRLAKHLASYKGEDQVVYAYKGATEGLRAKYAWSPYYKLKYIRNSAAIFTKTIKEDPDNAEIRFLRYSIEYYIPRYLNMSGHLQEDKAIFLEGLFQYPKSNFDADMFQIVKRFLLKHPDHLTEEERKKLTNLKA